MQAAGKVDEGASSLFPRANRDRLEMAFKWYPKPKPLAKNTALIIEPRPFAAFMRRKLREKGLLQQNVLLAADLSERFGYKLIAEEKHIPSAGRLYPGVVLWYNALV